jgi:hypothetical protein
MRWLQAVAAVLFAGACAATRLPQPHLVPLVALGALAVALLVGTFVGLRAEAKWPRRLAAAATVGLLAVPRPGQPALDIPALAIAAGGVWLLFLLTATPKAGRPPRLGTGRPSSAWPGRARSALLLAIPALAALPAAFASLAWADVREAHLGAGALLVALLLLAVLGAAALALAAFRGTKGEGEST